MEIQLRDATESDLPAIVDIYNQSVPGGWSTADTSPINIASRVEWFSKFSPDKRPIWVAELDGQVVAWIGLTSFYAGRPAYDATAEVSLYVATAYHRRGIGRYLKQRMIAYCPRLGVTTLLSMHFDHNEATHGSTRAWGLSRSDTSPRSPWSTARSAGWSSRRFASPSWLADGLLRRTAVAPLVWREVRGQLGDLSRRAFFRRRLQRHFREWLRGDPGDGSSFLHCT